jgi:hypothetical protein
MYLQFAHDCNTNAPDMAIVGHFYILIEVMIC